MPTSNTQATSQSEPPRRATVRVVLMLPALLAVTREIRAELIKADNTAWLGRVEDAFTWIITQETLTVLNFETEHEAVVVSSRSTPGRTYAANGTCTCDAHRRGNPCWHRAVTRLARRAIDRTNAEREEQLQLAQAMANDFAEAQKQRKKAQRRRASAAEPARLQAEAAIDELFPSIETAA